MEEQSRPWTGNGYRNWNKGWGRDGTRDPPSEAVSFLSANEPPGTVQRGDMFCESTKAGFMLPKLGASHNGQFQNNRNGVTPFPPLFSKKKRSYRRETPSLGESRKSLGSAKHTRARDPVWRVCCLLFSSVVAPFREKKRPISVSVWLVGLGGEGERERTSKSTAAAVTTTTTLYDDSACVGHIYANATIVHWWYFRARAACCWYVLCTHTERKNGQIGTFGGNEQRGRGERETLHCTQ